MVSSRKPLYLDTTKAGPSTGTHAASKEVATSTPAETATLQDGPDDEGVDWPDRTVGLGPDRTGLILVRSSPKVKDRTVKQSPFLVQTGLKLL